MPESYIPEEEQQSTSSKNQVDYSALKNRILPPTQSFFDEKTSPMAKRFSIHLGERKYEYRHQQNQMACFIAKTLEKGEHLCVEAPTGVGKSFAYLIPSIHYAKQTGLPTIICTETIALQEQLMDKDIPFIQSLLTELPFKAVLAKGRNNYLCKKRLHLCCSDPAMQMSGLQQDEFESIRQWSLKTQEGTLSAYPSELPSDALWQSINSESASCTYPKCPNNNNCFYWKDRKMWSTADILVANHAMLFTDLKLRLESPERQESLLPLYGALIIDEAHSIEDVAANHLGITIHEGGFHGMLNRLYDAKNAKGVLHACSGNSILEIRNELDRLHLTVNAFFDSLRQLYNTKTSQSESNFSETQMRLFDPIGAIDLLSSPLKIASTHLIDYLKDEKESMSEDHQLEANSLAQKLNCLAETLDIFTHQRFENHVYWISQSLINKHLTLSSAPLNVGGIFKSLLFANDSPPAILTSATLSVRNSFQYYTKRIGFDGKTERLDPLFDYQKQLEIHIPHTIADPSSKEYEKQLPDYIKHYIDLTTGGAFILFTSYASMRRCYTQLAPLFLEKNYNFMMQGDSNGLSRSQMLRSFKENDHSIIFGTSSFWTGVDVPGNALRNVIITKLPFPVPSSPLIQSRSERIEKNGGNPFRDYSLPEAVIKLRQGAGRLIRTQSDVGILVILDSRVLTKYYGQIFIESLPSCPLFKQK